MSSTISARSWRNKNNARTCSNCIDVNTDDMAMPCKKCVAFHMFVKRPEGGKGVKRGRRG